jgi:hypothetical protein
MLHRMRKLPSPALVIAFIALVAAIGTGSAWALSGSNSVFADDIRANAVGASEIKANAVGGSEIRANAVRGSELANNTVTSGEVRDNSLTGADIDESTLNVPNTGGGGNTGPNLISFTKRLAANETQTQTVGNFTVSSATNGAGTCGAIQLQSGNLDSQRSIGLAAAFANLAANATATITAANTSQAFTGVSDDGTSAVSGVVGRAQQGNTCLLTGYLTGN